MGTDYKAKKLWGADECLNYQNPSNESQKITDFTSSVTVTLKNAHKIGNETNTAGFVFAKIGEESEFNPYYLVAGGEKELDVRVIGSSAVGTTVTTVVIRGRK